MMKVYTNLQNGGPVSVYVEDGVVKRIRPLQVPESEYPRSWSFEAHGKKYTPPKAMYIAAPAHGERNRLYSKDRILYPMKRVDWDPKGERNPQNRGKSGYVRISWKEAVELVAGEIERVQSTYGEHALTAVASSHHNWGVAGYKFGPFNRFMNMMHYTPICDNPDSWEGWHWGATHMFGYYWRLGMVPTNDLMVDTMQNSEFMVFWSADPSSNRGGYNGQSNHRVRTWLKEMGMPTVCIDPHYNYTAAVMDSDWLPVYPGGDTALAAGIAYTWLTEGTYDKEYIAEKTYRFDAFEDYILGKEDGVPKTSQWAEEKSGVPARKIRALARFWASKRTCLAAGGRGGQGSACRTAHGTEWPRMMVALLAMQGWGKPGINLWSTTNGVPQDDIWFPGYSEPRGWMGMAPFVKYKLTAQNPTKQKLMRLTVPEAVMEGHDEYLGDGICGESLEQQFKVNKYPIEGEVKMFYRYGSSYMGTMVDTNKWVRLYQSDKFECVVNQDCWFGGESRFADIILPACTSYERDDVGEWSSAGGYAPGGYQGVFWRTIVRQQKCIEPLGESKSDYEIFSMIAERLGKKELYTDGGKTELDWCKAFFEESDLHQKGLITWEEFNEKGYYIVPFPEDYKPHVAMRWFAEGEADVTDMYSPVHGTEKANQLGSFTGKIEFVSESLKALAPEDDERPLTPKYIPSWEGRESELYKKYPLQIISPHPRFSFHTHYDKHMAWMDEVPTHRIIIDGYAYWTLRINPADAAERGIGKHDIVEVYNDRGSVLCAAVVTDRVPKGVLHSYGCSAKYDPIKPEPGATDRGGCINLLTPSRMISKRVAGMAVNSCLVEVRKWEV